MLRERSGPFGQAGDGVHEGLCAAFDEKYAAWFSSRSQRAVTELAHQGKLIYNPAQLFFS
jgi:hypothetical protein